VRGSIEQEWFKRAKVLRAAIRLKYALMAEDEINAALDAERKRYVKAVQKGQMPKAISAKALHDSA
jgi:hypothetical protein